MQKTENNTMKPGSLQLMKHSDNLEFIESNDVTINWNTMYYG